MRRAISAKPCEIILDRREAIAKALKIASEFVRKNMGKNAGAAEKKSGGSGKPVVLISGKGTDPYIMGANGTKTPWSDARVAREELEKMLAGK